MNGWESFRMTELLKCPLNYLDGRSEAVSLRLILSAESSSFYALTQSMKTLLRWLFYGTAPCVCAVLWANAAY